MKKFMILILAVRLLCSFGPTTQAQDAWWSLEGDFQNSADEVHLSFELINPVSSADAFWLRTFSYAGGANSVGDAISAGGFDPTITLSDVTSGEVLRGANDDLDSGLSLRDSWLTWSGVAPDPFPTDGYLNADPLTIGDYRADLKAYPPAYPEGDSPWALDLYGPWFPVTLTGVATSGSASLRSLKFGGDLGGSAHFDMALGSSATVSDELVVGDNGVGVLFVRANSTLNTPGTTSVGDDGDGRAHVWGPNALWNADQINVGSSLGGSGRLEIYDGAVVETRLGRVGGLGSPDGAATISGPGSQWNLSYLGLVGSFSTSAVGELGIDSGGQLSAAGLGVGTIGGTGVLTVDGATSTLNSSYLAVGGGFVTDSLHHSDGVGKLTVQNGATVNADAQLWLNSADDVVELLGGAINASSFFNDQGGTFTHEDGTLTVMGGSFAPGVAGINYAIDGAAAADLPVVVLRGGATTSAEPHNLYVGNFKRGRLELTEGSSLSAAGDAFLAWAQAADAHGELSVIDGSQFMVAGDLEVGDGRTGVMTIGPGGFVNSSGVGSSGRDVIGDDGTGHGTVAVRGDGAGVAASWHTDTLVVGENGHGQLTVELGGEVLSSAALVAAGTASTGQVTVQGLGSRWSVNNYVHVGGDGSSVGGTGLLTVQNGSSFDVQGPLRIWGGSTVELLGGNIDVQSLTINNLAALRHDDGRLTIHGGALDPVAAAGYTIDGASPGDLPVLRHLGGASTLGGGTALVIGDVNRGSLEIGDGARVLSNIGIIADDATSSGGSSVVVAGASSTWTLWSELEVGLGGVGSLDIADGGLVEITSTATHSGVVVGGLPSGDGEIFIRGRGSRLTTNHGVAIGTGGAGRLRIESGGSLSNPPSPNWEGIATGSNSTGSVEIVGKAPDATPSNWDSGAAFLAVGGSGRGTLTVADGGVMDLPLGYAMIGRWAGSNGSSATVEGPGSEWNIGGALYVGGSDLSSGGAGTLTVGDAAYVNVGDKINVWGPGAIELDGGRIVTNSLELDGALTGNGSIALAAGQAVVNRGIVSPGLSTGFISITGAGSTGHDYQQEASGTLVIEIAGTSSGDYDQLNVAVGEARLAGLLEVALPGLFSPSIGDSFEIIRAAEGFAGTEFTSTLFPSLPGKLWDIDYGADIVRLDVLAAFTADFDWDGDVDKDDLEIWKASFGINNNADADGDGKSAGADFLTWQRQHTGNLNPLSAAPEPGALSLLIGGIGLLLLARRH